MERKKEGKVHAPGLPFGLSKKKEKETATSAGEREYSTAWKVLDSGEGKILHQIKKKRKKKNIC